MSYSRLSPSSDSDYVERLPRPPRRRAPIGLIFRPRIASIISIVWVVILISYAFVTYSLARARATYSAFPSSLEVDLGYAVYRGYKYHHSGLIAWQGIRYAAPPVGDLRWRTPQPPEPNHDYVLDANAFGPRCPQSPSSPTPSGYVYHGDEDCLFLSVYAPTGARNLPVFVYIHGGGYGAGDGGKNVTEFTTMNSLAFVSVVVQYRLEAFGFLASAALANRGDLNVGLLDLHFSLEWVQEHISKFGGDSKRVTIAGQSAGGGSVEMMTMAYGGSEGTRLFEQGIASSPYNPVMYRFSDVVPEQNYVRFAAEAGCFSGKSHTQMSSDAGILDCLRNADTETLQLANFRVGSGTNFGSWAFVPVVDGTFIQQRPSQQLSAGNVNGKRMLTSYNANEGAQFVLPNITTAEDFDDWLLSEYPLLTQHDIDQINQVHYRLASSGAELQFATCGDCSSVATAVSVGSFATGHLQRAMNFYAEATFDCPSYWLASAYQNRGSDTDDRAAYLYQFSIPAADHGADLMAEGLTVYRAEWHTNVGPDFHAALTTAWGNFVRSGDPSLSEPLANGASSPSSSGSGKDNPATQWPLFTTEGKEAWRMLNLNQTGGVKGEIRPVAHLDGSVDIYLDPGLSNDFRLVNASTWEGGRGARCEFLRSIGGRIPV